MDPAPAESAEHLRRLRQQLLLAQARVMEIEDERDTAQQQLHACETHLRAAQQLADQTLDRADHLDRTLADLKNQFQHLQHVQHVTNEALNETRARATELGSLVAGLESTRFELSRAHAATTAELASAREQWAEASRTRDAHAARIAELDTEQRALKASRSWRWTAWLRSLERAFGAKR